MALYHVIGNAIVSQEEITYRAKELDKYKLGQVAGVAFSTGEVSREHEGPNLRDATGREIPFQPIGYGKPLTVQLRHIYRGEHPSGRKPERKRMLVTSAMKSVGQIDAQPRAINFLTGEIGTQTGFSYVAATEQGTPIVYYSSALTVQSSVVTIEVGFNDFDASVLNEVGGLLEEVGAIPAFIAHAAYLIGAGAVVKLAARVAERLFERGPVFRASELIDFVTPGTDRSQEGFKILVPEEFPGEVLRTHRVNSNGQLVDAQARPYAGPLPYVTLSLDGTEREEFENFEVTQASAALLADFFAVRDGQRTNMDVVLEGIKLYSDLKFRRKADRVKERMDRIGDPNDPEYGRLKEQYDALIENIKEEKLRPAA